NSRQIRIGDNAPVEHVTERQPEIAFVVVTGYRRVISVGNTGLEKVLETVGIGYQRNFLSVAVPLHPLFAGVKLRTPALVLLLLQHVSAGFARTELVLHLYVFERDIQHHRSIERNPDPFLSAAA